MKLRLIEPERWYALLQKGIAFSEAHPRLVQIAPIGADIFVFLYPIFLIIFYLKGVIKKQTESKEGALFVFLSCCISMLINIFIQCFFLKTRPNVDLLNTTAGETMFHKFLPGSSFPSDHAVVGMSIAVATLIRGYKIKARYPKRGKRLIFLWYFLVLCALTMGGCRILTIVHRPSDIIGGLILGLLIPLILASSFVFPYVKKWLISPLIQVQERIFWWFKKK